MKRHWYETLSERQREMREKNYNPKVIKRSPYVRGVKEYLASFAKGECRVYCGDFSWYSLRSTAQRMKSEFGSLFLFNTIDGQHYITRVL